MVLDSAAQLTATAATTACTRGVMEALIDGHREGASHIWKETATEPAGYTGPAAPVLPGAVALVAFSVPLTDRGGGCEVPEEEPRGKGEEDDNAG